MQQERQRAFYRQLRADVADVADVEEVLELRDGYAFRHERAGGPVWLRMTGGKPSVSWRRRWVPVLEGTAIPSVERPLPGPFTSSTGFLRLEVADGLAALSEQGQEAMTQIAEPDRGETGPL